MGYELHVTRAERWWDSESAPIALEEWLAYVASDSELRLDDAAEAALDDGSVLRYGNPGLAVWTAYAAHGVGGNLAWLDFREGRIVVNNPDGEIIGKLCRIAEQLSAHVLGDDGERYAAEAPVLAPQAASQGDPSVLARLRSLFQRRPAQPPIETKLRKGQRYRYLLGGTCTVVKVDARAAGGLGLLTVEFDDGRRLSFALAGGTDSLFHELG